MDSKSKQHVLRIDDFHHQYYKSLKRKAMSYEKSLGSTIKEYKKAQTLYSKRPFSLATEEELFNSIKQSSITYLGDFHTFDQSIKNLNRILKFLQQDCQQDIVLGMELVHTHHQKELDQFLQEEISEEEFLKKIDYSESWKFPWAHYKRIFDFSIEHSIPILALNSSGSLAQRDFKAARRIKNQLKKAPQQHLLVLFGELHILPSKLPQKVKQLLNGEVQHTIIHQNLDEVFWQQEELKQKGEIVKFNREEFSLQTSPPWLKYESMIFWYEHLVEDPDFDIHNYVIETGKLIFNNDIYDNFLFLAKKVKDSLNIKKELENLEDFTLYDYENLKELLTQINHFETNNKKEFYRRILLKGEVFSLPSSHIYYCSSYTITRIAYLAGIHVYKTFSDERNLNHKKSKLSTFMHIFKECFFGYLGSKIVNPSRKCSMYQDFLHCDQDTESSASDKKISKQALKLIDSPTSAYEQITANNHYHNFLLAKKLAHFIAELVEDRLTEERVKEFNRITRGVLEGQNDKKNLLQILQEVQQFNYKESKKPYF